MTNLDNFKQIPGYEDYLINENGQVYSTNSNKILSPGNGRHGYLYVVLCRNKKHKTFLIHRLVAMTFLDNPNNYPIINHKDGNKLNNNISNLEWCTYSQNNKHAYDYGLNENGRQNCKNVGKIYGKIYGKLNTKHLDDNLKELFDDIFKNQLKQKDICQKYNLKSSYVSYIKSKRRLKTALNEYFSNNPGVVYQPKSNKVKKTSLKEKIQNLISKYTGDTHE